jgi:predicted HTH domain antitoxin
MQKHIIVIGHGNQSKEIVEAIEKLSKATGVTVEIIKEHIDTLQQTMKLSSMSLPDMPPIKKIMFKEIIPIEFDKPQSKFIGNPKRNYKK